MENIKTRLARYKRKTFKQCLKLVDAVFFTNYKWEYVFRNNGYHTPFYHFGKEKIVFVHLPKTGGSSFYKLLAKDPQSRFITQVIHRPIALAHPPAEFKYITILRNPIYRVWSLYQMILRQPKDYPYRKYAVKSLDCFLKNCWEARDMACRYYTGLITDEPTADTMQKALLNLKDFYAVLFFEQFTEEVDDFLLAHEIQYDKIPHERKSSYDKPGEKDVQLIKSYNQFDIQLYQAYKNEIARDTAHNQNQ